MTYTICLCYVSSASVIGFRLIFRSMYIISDIFGTYPLHWISALSIYHLIYAMPSLSQF